MADTSKLCPGLHTSGFLGSFHVCDNIESIPAEDMTAGSCSEYILDTMLFCVLFGRAAGYTQPSRKSIDAAFN